jgi:acyl-CoA dehydrogenase
MPAIAFDYPDDVLAIREGVTDFIRKEILPRHERHEALFSDQRRKYEPDGRWSPVVWDIISEVRMLAAEAGWYGLAVPTSLGGGGFGYLAYFAVWERISHLCGPRHWLAQYIVSHWARGPSRLLEHVTPEAAKTVTPDLVRGKTTMCFALSEPEAGSDAAMIKTRAEPDAGGWRLSGTKIWITNSPHADYAVVFAVTDPERAANRKGGISAFLVPTDSPGFSLDRTIKMWGHPSSDEALLRFDSVRIEPWQLLGELHNGFKLALLGVGLGRMYNSARGVGYGRWALDQAVEYAKVRKTFGKTLSEYQGVMFPLAESAMELHGAHLMALNAAQLLDRGLPAVKELSMAKAFAAQAGKRAVDRAMQAHGAMGFTNELQLTEAYASMARINIADGSWEILRNTVGKHLLKGDLDL